MFACGCWDHGPNSALQESRAGDTNIEYAIATALDERKIPYRRGGFESIIINDEYIWEAYGIPTCSLSRMPYPEYHSSRDNLSIIGEKELNEAVEILKGTLQLLEKWPFVYKKFEGNVCLSNPRYNLYIDPGQISFGERQNDDTKKLRILMDLIPSIPKAG